VQESGSTWALAPQSRRLQAAMGAVRCSWPQHQGAVRGAVLARATGKAHSRTGHQKAAKSYLARRGEKAPDLCFITWIRFSQEIASDVSSDLVYRCFSQALLQRYSCDTCRNLSLICSNAQALCKCLLKIYELFTVNSTSFGFSGICSAQ